MTSTLNSENKYCLQIALIPLNGIFIKRIFIKAKFLITDIFHGSFAYNQTGFTPNSISIFFFKFTGNHNPMQLSPGNDFLFLPDKKNKQHDSIVYVRSNSGPELLFTT